MIYLVDDTPIEKGQLPFLEDSTFSKFLVRITTIEAFENAVSEMEEKAECIMVHSSFNSSQQVREDVRDLTDDGEKMPLVVFSGEGIDVLEELDFNYMTLKKSTFYANLECFLLHYKETGCISRLLLQYGKALFSETNLRAWTLDVLKATASKTGKVTAEDVEQIVGMSDFNHIVSAAQPAAGKTAQQITTDMQNGSVSYADLRDNLTHILLSYTRYGKNIYTWQ